MKIKPTISELREMVKESYERFKPTMERLALGDMKYFKVRLNLGIPYGDIYIEAFSYEEARDKLIGFQDQTAKVFGGSFSKEFLDQLISQERIFPVTIISKDGEITIHRS